AAEGSGNAGGHVYLQEANVVALGIGEHVAEEEGVTGRMPGRPFAGVAALGYRLARFQVVRLHFLGKRGSIGQPAAVAGEAGSTAEPLAVLKEGGSLAGCRIQPPEAGRAGRTAGAGLVAPFVEQTAAGRRPDRAGTGR